MCRLHEIRRNCGADKQGSDRYVQSGVVKEDKDANNDYKPLNN